jgi:methylated-DNA-[protein]-cysteine S-methyltransferase
MKTTTMTTPVGPLVLAGDESVLREIRFEVPGRPSLEPTWEEDSRPFVEAKRQLERYFAGELRRFDLALAPSGTAFQLLVWQALAEIPFGATISYGELARRIGRPSAARAVGAANGQNPLPIVLPCHRVIGSDGSLTGYGGGLERKRALLALEGWTPGGAAAPRQLALGL